MPGVLYHHIGHDPKHGPIALWSIDEQGKVHERRRRFAQADGEWLDWSHENQFREIKIRALGRVELDRRAGSIHLTDTSIGRSDARLCRLLETLDRLYPQVRWYVFGVDYRGESADQVLATM